MHDQHYSIYTSASARTPWRTEVQSVPGKHSTAHGMIEPKIAQPKLQLGAEILVQDTSQSSNCFTLQLISATLYILLNG